MDMTPEAQAKKKKKERNWISSKLKTFVHQGILSRKLETAYRTKENIYKSDVGLAFRICKELLQFKNKPPD